MIEESKLTWVGFHSLESIVCKQRSTALMLLTEALKKNLLLLLILTFVCVFPPFMIEKYRKNITIKTTESIVTIAL